jgi:hypothetical protein
MKLPPWGRFWVYLSFREDLDKSKTRRVEFELFKYAIYFNFRTDASCWDEIASIVSGRGVGYLPTKGAKRHLGSLFKALAEGENDETIKKQIGVSDNESAK